MLGNIWNWVITVTTAGLVTGFAALQLEMTPNAPKSPPDAAVKTRTKDEEVPARSSPVIKAAARDAAVIPVKAIEVIGQRELPIIVERANESSAEVRVAARFEPPESSRSVEFLTISALRGGRVVPSSSFRLTADPETSTLKATVDLSAAAAAAGSYVVKFRASPQDPSVKPSIDLDFTLTRPPAELRIATPLKLERVIYIPFCCGDGPGSLVAAEVSRRSPLLPATKSWSSSLRRPDNTLSGRLVFDLSKSIDAGGEAIVPVSFAEFPWVGTTSGILTIVSPQLSNDAIELPFELVTRVCGFWLFLVIVLGVAVGYKFRTRLEAKRARLKAIATAQERQSELDALIESEKDKEFHGDLERILGTLLAGCGPTAAPDSIERAAQTAATATTELLTRKTAKQANIRNRTATLRAAFGADYGLPEALRIMRTDALGDVTDAEKALGEGLLATAEKAATELEAQLKARLEKTAGDWSNSVSTALDDAGTWPDTSLPDCRRRFEERVESFNKLNEEEFKGRFWALVGLEEVVRNDVLARGVHSVVKEAADVHAALATVDQPGLKEPLRLLWGELAALKSSLEGAKIETMKPTGEAANRVFNQLSAALKQAAAAAPGGRIPTQGLLLGKFKEVLQAVLDADAAAKATPGQESTRGLGRDLGGEGRSAEATPRPAGVPAAAVVSPLAPVDRSTWSIVIDGPAEAIVGRTFPLRVRFVPEHALPSSKVFVTWTVDGEEQGTSGLMLSFQPREPRRVVVRAEAEAAGGEHRTAVLVLQVRPRAAKDVLADTQVELRNVEFQQAVVAGLVIAVTGFFLYQGAFRGAPEDFLIAFLWGFSVDVSVAEALKRLTPITAKNPQSTPA